MLKLSSMGRHSGMHSGGSQPTTEELEEPRSSHDAGGGAGAMLASQARETYPDTPKTPKQRVEVGMCNRL